MIDLHLRRSPKEPQRTISHNEGWALKNWCFQTVVLEKTLESPLDSKEIESSILKKINPEYPLEGLLLKRKLQYFGHMMQRADSLEKTLMLGKTECRRRRGWQRMRWLDGIINSRNINLSKKMPSINQENKAGSFPERQIIDASELWCWRTFLRVPWTAERSNSQSWRK